jgi:hypothetical protein
VDRGWKAAQLEISKLLTLSFRGHSVMDAMAQAEFISKAVTIFFCISTCNRSATCGTVSQAEEAVMITIFQFGHQMQPANDRVGSSWLLLATTVK